jgi:hypothetical protein
MRLKIDAARNIWNIAHTPRSSEFVWIAPPRRNFAKSLPPTLIANRDTSKSLTTSGGTELFQRRTSWRLKPDIATRAVTKTFLAIAVLPVWDIALALPFGWVIGAICESLLTFTTTLPITA